MGRIQGLFLSKPGWVQGFCWHYLEYYQKGTLAPIKRDNGLNSSSRAFTDGLLQIGCGHGNLEVNSDSLVLQQPIALYLCLGQAKWLLERHLEVGHQKAHYCRGQNCYQFSVLGSRDRCLLSTGLSIFP